MKDLNNFILEKLHINKEANFDEIENDPNYHSQFNLDEFEIGDKILIIQDYSKYIKKYSQRFIKPDEVPSKYRIDKHMAETNILREIDVDFAGYNHKDHADIEPGNIRINIATIKKLNNTEKTIIANDGENDIEFISKPCLKIKDKNNNIIKPLEFCAFLTINDNYFVGLMSKRNCIYYLENYIKHGCKGYFANASEIYDKRIFKKKYYQEILDKIKEG